jgi:hypothetical protein
MERRIREERQVGRRNERNKDEREKGGEDRRRRKNKYLNKNLV